jgi:hypothetical protein
LLEARDGVCNNHGGPNVNHECLFHYGSFQAQIHTHQVGWIAQVCCLKNRMIFKFSIVWLFVSYAPDSNSDTPLFSGLSGKKMALLVGIIIAGGFFGIQAMFGFPIKDLIRKDVTNEVKVITKAEGTCVVEASDHQPRGIPHCPYNVGDRLIVTFRQGTAPIEKAQLKN